LSDSTDVLVIGAGPTGLALACGLLAQGVSVRVMDQASGPAVTSRANILHARGVEVLDRLGALGDLPQRAETALQITSYVGGRPMVTVRFGDVGLGTARPALYISQAEIEAALRSRLAELGGSVEWNTALVDATQDASGIAAALGNGQTVHAGWLAGCDGTHSSVRRLAGIAFPGAAVTDEWLLADVHADWAADRAGGHGWLHRDGPFFAMPMHEAGGADDLWRLMTYYPLVEDERLEEQEILDLFRRLLPARTGQTDVRIRDATWTSVFRIHRRLADDYRRGRIVLAGDAAHTHSPQGGQGMNTGIGDAENVAWKLALVVRGRAAEPLLDTYQAERRPLAMEVLRGTTAATRFFLGEGLLMRFLRDRVVAPLVSLPSVQRRGTQLASQLWVTYRRGPLGGGLGSRFGRRPRPGDRVADLACRRPDASITRLHAELGRRWALLAPDGSANGCLSAARKWLGDDVVTLTPESQRHGEVWLVRPDAHLAWRGRPESGSLDRWLENALRHGRAR